MVALFGRDAARRTGIRPTGIPGGLWRPPGAGGRGPGLPRHDGSGFGGPGFTGPRTGRLSLRPWRNPLRARWHAHAGHGPLLSGAGSLRGDAPLLPGRGPGWHRTLLPRSRSRRYRSLLSRGRSRRYRTLLSGARSRWDGSLLPRPGPLRGHPALLPRGRSLWPAWRSAFPGCRGRAARRRPVIPFRSFGHRASLRRNSCFRARRYRLTRRRVPGSNPSSAGSDCPRKRCHSRRATSRSRSAQAHAVIIANTRP